MSSYENDHPAAAEPDAVNDLGMSLDDILDELHETGGEGIVLTDGQGRRILGEGIVELMAGQLGRIRGGASEQYIASLPSATSDQIDKSGETACSICQTSFQILLDEEEHLLALSTPSVAPENLGVVRIGDGCSHLFCRRDASRWLSKSNSCPLCRSACDLSVSSAVSNPASHPDTAQHPGAPPSAGPDGRTPAQMMQMLQDLLESGEFPTGFGGPPQSSSGVDSRDNYSSMYS